VSVKETYKGSANNDYSSVEQGQEEEEENGEMTVEKERDDDHSTRVNCTHSSIEAERKTPEPQSPTAVPAKASATARDSAQKQPQEAAF
jgi:hypothetical protein